MTLLSYRSNSDWSKVCMPRLRLFFMISLISETSPLKIRSEISGVFSITSTAAARPLPSCLGIRRCEIMPRRFSDRSISNWSRRSSGKKFTMRSSAWLALLACSVARHRWPVADLTHQDHVGGLAQRVLERGLPAVGVQPHLAVGHHAVLVRVHELDRVFDRDDVAVGVLVAPVHHRGQGGRFARAGVTHHDAQAALGHGHFLEHLGQAQVVDGGQGHRDHPQHHADLALLQKGVDAEAADAGRRNREIALLGALELGRLLVVHDRAGQGHRVHRGQRLGRDLGDAPVHLDGGRKVGRDEQVAAVPAHHELEQIVDEFARLIAFHVGRSCCGGCVYFWWSLSRALTTRRRSESLRASKATKLAASWGAWVIISSRASALSTATSQGVSVVQAEKRMPLSSSDISPRMSPGRVSARRRCSPQGCTRSTAMVPLSSTTMKLPYSSCRIRSRLAGTVAKSKKRSMRSMPSVGN